MMQSSHVFLLLMAILASSLSQDSAIKISEIRLVGGSGPHEGNIQVKEEETSEWKYICDDGFGFAEADLLCQELGYELADRFTKNNHFGTNTAELRRSPPNFLLDRLNCSQTNTTYKDCPHAEPAFHDCVATEIAGVECSTNSSSCQSDEFPCRDSIICVGREEVCDGFTDCLDMSDNIEELCSDMGVARVSGNVKVNIPGAILGTVQVKFNEEWGVMCDDLTTEKDAKVICRMMGYGEGWVAAFKKSYFGPIKGKLFADAPGCSGNEQSVNQCPDFIKGVSPCTEEEGFGVFCYNEGVELRLAGGSSSTGRVEMKMAGQWGSICDSGFDIFDAQVICRMLGYQGDAIPHRQSGTGTGPIWDFRLDCLGNEQDIQGCRLKILTDSCPVSNTAGVTCSHQSGQVASGMKIALGNIDCGMPEDSSDQFLTNIGKIRGGVFSSRFDIPWIASFYAISEESIIIGVGAIISEDFIVTTATLFNIRGKLNSKVRVGDYNVNYEDESEEEFLIDKIWIHENKDELGRFDNDIALVKIERKNGRGIRFGARVKPICLPSVHDNYSDLSKCTIVGWGLVDHDGFFPARPITAETDVRPDYQCDETDISSSENYSSSMMCVGHFTPAVSTCAGDNGAPFSCPVEGRQTLYGLASNFKGCTPAASLEIYTRVSKFVDWILSKILELKNEHFQ